MKFFVKPLILSVFAFNFIFLSCKCSDDKPLTRNPKPWDKVILSVDDLQEQKVKINKVKEKLTYSKFYNKFGKLDTAKYLVERALFNDEGQKEKVIQYLSTGEIDIQWEYEYKNELPVHITAKNKFDEVVYEKIIKYDENWDEIEIKELNQKSKDYYKTLIKYDINKLVTEALVLDPHGNQNSRQKFEYAGKKLSKIFEYDKRDELTTLTEMYYDSLGNLIRETKEVKIYNAKYEKTIQYKDGKVYQIDDNEMQLSYDYEKDRITKEHYFIPNVGPQRRFDYFYNKKGLMKTKVSVSGMGMPELHIYYRYKYY